MNVCKVIKKVVGGADLTGREMSEVFCGIMSGKLTPSQIASLLTALRIKGETTEEITAAARVMRRESLKLNVSGDSIDTCGTGGSGLNIFNFSTASAFVVSGCGIKVAKHGNRSSSGKCGSADVLEALGVKIDVSPDLTEKCINNIGIGFMYAPLYHKSMKYAVAPRKEIGIRTIFNILGPLCNPASPRFQLMAVSEAGFTAPIAEVLGKLGVKRAFVVHGEDGLDEVTITGRTRVSELKHGKVITYSLKPSDFGFRKAPLKEIIGGSPKTNSGIMTRVLSGKKGPVRDMLLMNAALAIVAFGKANGLGEAVKMAADSIDSGRAAEKLEALCLVTRGETGEIKEKK